MASYAYYIYICAGAFVWCSGFTVWGVDCAFLVQATVVDVLHSLYASVGTVQSFRGVDAVLEIDGREETIPLTSLVQSQRL